MGRKPDKPSSARCQTKHNLVSDDLLRRIQGGEWKPGCQIPTVDDLAAAYPYSRATVLRGVQQLVKEGFLSSSRKTGTYVRRQHRPLCLGLAMGHLQLDPQRTPFSYLVSKFLHDYCSRMGHALEFFYEQVKGGKGEDVSTPQLPEALEAERIDGLVAVSCSLPSYLRQIPAYRAKPVPAVMLGGNTSIDHRVDIDNANAFQMAIRLAVNQGCKTADFMRPGPDDARKFEELCQSLKMGFSVCCDMMDAGMGHEEYGYRKTISRWSGKKLPDAIFITDDVIAKGVTQALLSLCGGGKKQPLVFAATNKGSSIFYPLPVIRLELDVEECARSCAELLVRLINNPQLPPCVEVVTRKLLAEDVLQASSRG